MLILFVRVVRDFVSEAVVVPVGSIGVGVGAGRDNAVAVNDVEALTKQFDDFLRDGFERLFRHRNYWCITIRAAVKRLFSFSLFSYPRA